MSRTGTMNFSLDFMGCLPGDVGTSGPPSMAARICWSGDLVLTREDDLDASVARPAVGRGVGGERVVRAVARGREAAGRDVVTDQESDDGRGARGGQLPVGGELAARDALVVGVAL